MSEPGWYHDPADPTRLRLWNGSAWTDETRDLSSVTAPPPTPPPPPAASVPAVAFPPPSTPASPPTLSFSPTTLSPQRAPGRGWWVVTGIASVLAIAAAAAAVVVTTSRPAPVSVTLLAATDPGANPFATDVVSQPLVPLPGPSLPPGSGQASLTEIPAPTPGLFASAGDADACNIDLVAGALLENPDGAAAFAAAAGVSEEALPQLLAGLTPVVLRYDTRVTSHGRTGPTPQAAQAVLQAGTAVLIDPWGTPRVRCTGANPLTSPTVAEGEATFAGTSWAGFDATRLTSVIPSTEPLTTIEVATAAGGQQRQLLGAGGLVLQPDGLGLVTIGDPTDEVLTRLTAVLGNPTVVEDTFIDGGLFLRVSWRSLTTIFQLPRGVAGEESTRFGFQGYLFGPWTVDADGDPIWWVGLRGDDGTWQPTNWERSLATPEGIRIQGAAALATATYPATTLTRDFLPNDTETGKNSICAVRIPHEGINPLPDLPINDQRISVDEDLDGLFLAPAQNDRVWGIGAGVLCFT